MTTPASTGTWRSAICFIEPLSIQSKCTSLPRQRLNAATGLEFPWRFFHQAFSAFLQEIVTVNVRPSGAANVTEPDAGCIFSDTLFYRIAGIHWQRVVFLSKERAVGSWESAGEIGGQNQTRGQGSDYTVSSNSEPSRHSVLTSSPQRILSSNDTVDHGAAETAASVIEDRKLAGCHRPL